MLNLGSIVVYIGPTGQKHTSYHIDFNQIDLKVLRSFRTYFLREVVSRLVRLIDNEFLQNNLM